jgi:hypothetical protein
MPIVKYSDLHEYMIPELPGCPPAVVNQALWRAGREFVDRSKVWEETLDAINLVAAQAEYFLRVKWRAVVDAIIEVRINTAAGVTAGIDGTRMNDSLYWLERTDSSTGFKLVLADSEAPAEAVTDGLVVKASLVPTPGEHELPQWLFERYFEGIVGLAMFDLMTQNRDDSWHNPPRAGYYRKRAMNVVGSGRSDRIQKGRARPRGLLEDEYEHEGGGFEW